MSQRSARSQRLSGYKYRIYRKTYSKSEPWEHAKRMGSSLALDSRVYGSNILWGGEGGRAGKRGIDSSLKGGGELRHGGRGDERWKERGRNGAKGKRNTTIERAREDRTTRSFLDSRYEDGEEEVTVKHLAVYVPKLWRQVLGSSVVGIQI